MNLGAQGGARQYNSDDTERTICSDAQGHEQPYKKNSVPGVKLVSEGAGNRLPVGRKFDHLGRKTTRRLLPSFVSEHLGGTEGFIRLYRYVELRLMPFITRTGYVSQVLHYGVQSA